MQKELYGLYQINRTCDTHEAEKTDKGYLLCRETVARAPETKNISETLIVSLCSQFVNTKHAVAAVAHRCFKYFRMSD